MSTDYDIVCDICHVRRHLGQCGTGGESFGYGKNDTHNQSLAMHFIQTHYRHKPRILVADQLEDDPADEYEVLEPEDQNVDPDDRVEFLEQLAKKRAVKAAEKRVPYEIMRGLTDPPWVPKLLERLDNIERLLTVIEEQYSERAKLLKRFVEE